MRRVVIAISDLEPVRFRLHDQIIHYVHYILLRTGIIHGRALIELAHNRITLHSIVLNFKNQSVSKFVCNDTKMI